VIQSRRHSRRNLHPLQTPSLGPQWFRIVEITKGMYGLPQAGKLANDLLAKCLAKHGYYQSPTTAGLWKHTSRSIQFTLIVNDFGLEDVGKEHALHLLEAIRQDYKCSTDWTGSLYTGIDLNWNYTTNILKIAMSGYVAEHPKLAKPQDSPYQAAPIQYGSPIQMTEPSRNNPPCDKKQQKQIQKIIGTFLYYAYAIDSTMNAALSSLASEQSEANAHTITKIQQFLDYAATHADATVTFTASDMKLKIHSNSSYLLSELKA
jgi:hypothetical protein